MKETVSELKKELEQSQKEVEILLERSRRAEEGLRDLIKENRRYRTALEDIRDITTRGAHTFAKNALKEDE